MCDDTLSPAVRSAGGTDAPPGEASFYRYQIGAITITALCDGHFPLLAHDILRTQGTTLEQLLTDASLESVVPSHVNAFLIDDGVHRTLIDAGAGELQDATLGRMGAQLISAGYQPADVDRVLVTHLHPDHIGGLTRNGMAVFPSAVVHVPREEAAFWLGTADSATVDPSVRATFVHARQTLAPYIAEARCVTFDPDASWHGYLQAESLPGHTRGHTGFRLRTEERDVVFCGDLFHVAAVQLADPGVTVCYDSEPARARATRQAFLAQACRRGDVVAAAHAPFPGLGYLRNDFKGYAWHAIGAA